jgi:hypothetical protein
MIHGHPTPLETHATVIATIEAVELQCAVGNCRSAVVSHQTGFCDYHQKRFLAHIHKHTQNIGRGTLL